MASLVGWFLDRLRLNSQAPDYYGDILQQELAGDGATLIKII